MGTLADFVTAHGVTATVSPALDNPHMDDMPEGSRHWRVMLNCGGRCFTVPFSQGPALTDPPTVEDVLDCLASDAAGTEEYTSFGEWASAYGYDEDSRSAERAYNAACQQSEALWEALGAAAFEELLWDTERL